MGRFKSCIYIKGADSHHSPCIRGSEIPRNKLIVATGLSRVQANRRFFDTISPKDNADREPLILHSCLPNSSGRSTSPTWTSSRASILYAIEQKVHTHNPVRPWGRRPNLITSKLLFALLQFLLFAVSGQVRCFACGRQWQPYVLSRRRSRVASGAPAGAQSRGRVSSAALLLSGSVRGLHRLARCIDPDVLPRIGPTPIRRDPDHTSRPCASPVESNSQTPHPRSDWPATTFPTATLCEIVTDEGRLLREFSCTLKPAASVQTPSDTSSA